MAHSWLVLGLFLGHRLHGFHGWAGRRGRDVGPERANQTVEATATQPLALMAGPGDVRGVWGRRASPGRSAASGHGPMIRIPSHQTAVPTATNRLRVALDSCHSCHSWSSSWGERRTTNHTNGRDELWRLRGPWAGLSKQRGARLLHRDRCRLGRGDWLPDCRLRRHHTHDIDVEPIAISAASPFCRTSASNSPHSEAAIQSNLDLPHIGGNGGHRLAPARPPHLDLGRHGPERSR